ncbi:uncharacterized protein LOC129894721 [Solanum dulcamara]|uniref:uncharacterized protein LOC129894721 n=1 Tax=Solanum dulcamara TaxID=45834 RepID=UPI0024855B21|nr:uncharacterized protein LOC129894721 [Solanum dulcamara]
MEVTTRSGIQTVDPPMPELEDDVHDVVVVNVSLLEALEKMLGYAKFMKDLVTKKRIISFELVGNLHHYNAIATRSLLQKKEDPSAFTIPCTIGVFNFAKVLCNLGASIYLMPLAVLLQLHLGAPKSTSMRLLMADHTMKKPMGIIYDFLVKVESFIFPADFVILDCEVDFDIPIILGRPFLATGRALEDMETGKLKF